MKWKDTIIQHDKKGKITMGKLSHNELGRGALEAMNSNNQLKFELQHSFLVYANHLASFDACNEKEWNELHG